MRKLVAFLLLFAGFAAWAQPSVSIVAAPGEEYAAQQLASFLQKGGCYTTQRTHAKGITLYVGMPSAMRQSYQKELDQLSDGGYLIASDSKKAIIHGAGSKGTLYAVYAFLEELGYRLYTPSALIVPDLRQMQLPTCHRVSNPAFDYREVCYYYPAHSQLYADWHHLHTSADRTARWGMFVHTFSKLLPPDRYFEAHPEWFSLNNGRRSRDGQLCLSNPQVLDTLCQQLANAVASHPEKRIWSVSPNDNYNVCQCPNCKQMDSLYGGASGTLVNFVNQVARQFPTKTIATLAYQYTRRPPTKEIIPDSNVLIMLCPIEAGREQPIATAPAEVGFRSDIERWHTLTEHLFLWDYVVQFRNFWNPFPNLHVLQPNLQYFHSQGVQQMFEQASGDDNITSWMDIRCYMIAKLLWNPNLDLDSLMADFYKGYYAEAAPYVQSIIDTMTRSLVTSGQRLNIYGYSVDGCFKTDKSTGYLWPENIDHYRSLLDSARAICSDTAVLRRLRFLELSLDFATVELMASQHYGTFDAQNTLAMTDSLVADLQRFGVPQMMEMGHSPAYYGSLIHHLCRKSLTPSIVHGHNPLLHHSPTPPYDDASLTDGQAGLLDYRHQWLGFWGKPLEATFTIDSAQTIHSVCLDFFFYPLSWIFLPKSVSIWGSNDGQAWQLLDEQFLDNPQVLATPGMTTVNLQPKLTHPFQILRLVAEPIDEIPSWHRAAGEKAWIFADEIIIQ